MKNLTEIVRDIILENLKNDRYILLPFGEYNDEDFEQYDIDMYVAGDLAMDIAKSGGVNILRDKRLSSILLDVKIPRVIGGVWVSDDSNKFSFDIAIDSSYQNMGLSHLLVKDAISEYKIQKDIYDDMGEDFGMEVDVINPKLAKILKDKYGFRVVGELSQNRVLMSMD
jgi:ribosomal protein S18 acetylase RimI-like enzyme